MEEILLDPDDLIQCKSNSDVIHHCISKEHEPLILLKKAVCTTEKNECLYQELLQVSKTKHLGTALHNLPSLDPWLG